MLVRLEILETKEQQVILVHRVIQVIRETKERLATLEMLELLAILEMLELLAILETRE